MDLSEADLRAIRDEIGDGGPTDDQLYELADVLGSWQEVAVSVLRRRRAAALGGGTESVASESFTIPGVLSFSSGASAGSQAAVSTIVAALDAQIARLSGQVGLSGGVLRGGQLVRTDTARYSGGWRGVPAERFIEGGR